MLGFLFTVLLVCVSVVLAENISCRNEAGEPVDWFIIYKLPKHLEGESGSGVDYLYLDSQTDSWVKSENMINTTEGAMGRTLSQLYDGRTYESNSSVYAIYNDAPPVLEYSMEYGHTKGLMLFDASLGFFLSHSVPHFPSFPQNGYIYPKSGKLNGQTALCVTHNYQQFALIVQQLLYIKPRFYNCSVPSAFSSHFSELLKMCDGSEVHTDSDTHVQHLPSHAGQTFTSFVKSRHFVDDIYSGWVAQLLAVDLLVESWQNTGHALGSNCSLTHHALNVRSVQTPSGATGKPRRFLSRHDHSKWCVSRDEAGEEAGEDGGKRRVVCLGDLNRDRSQMRRGGGLICTNNTSIYTAFRTLVQEYEPCY